MFANERYSRILNRIREQGSVKVSELVEEWELSAETLRRDLLFLENQNRLQRVHGGAIALTNMKTYQELSQRFQENKAQKEQLSDIAALLVREGDILAIDAGSTAVEFLRVLKNRFHRLTIVTHSIQNFEEIRYVEGFRPIFIGGEYLKKEDLFYGALATDMIQKLHVSTCFLFPSAISLKHGVGDYIVESVPVQKAYLEMADRIVILADSSKFEKTAFLRICNTEISYTYITDESLEDGIYELYRNKGITLYKNKRQLNDANHISQIQKGED